MLVTVLGWSIALMPFAAIAALLRLAERLGRRRADRYARQIRLTDAIHVELGAVAAPVVARRFGGGWLVSVAVPLERPDIVAAIVRITDRVFGERGTESFRIVLTPRESPAARREARPTSSRPVLRRSAAALR